MEACCIRVVAYIKKILLKIEIIFSFQIITMPFFILHGGFTLNIQKDSCAQTQANTICLQFIVVDHCGLFSNLTWRSHIGFKSSKLKIGIGKDAFTKKKEKEKKDSLEEVLECFHVKDVAVKLNWKTLLLDSLLTSSLF